MIINKLLSPHWFAHRILREYRRPTTQVGKILFEKPREWIVKKRKLEKNIPLLAIYDLQVAPITFNFAEFLVLANLECLSRGLAEYEVLLVPRVAEVVLDGSYDRIHDEDSKAWRLRQIIMPLVFMSPLCKGVRLLPNRECITSSLNGFQVFPLAYSKNYWQVPDHTRIYRELTDKYVGLYPGDQALRYIDRWISANANGLPVVSLTYRQQKYAVNRNSQLAEAIKFLEWVKEQGYFPVLIPDTDVASEVSQYDKGIYLFSDLAWNLELRAAFYQQAALNFFVPNGTTSLAIFNQKTRYVIMRFNEGGDAHEMDRIGLKKGNNLPFATKGQILVWSDDTLSEYIKIFQLFRDNDWLGRGKDN
jgi:hypothetical protein